MTLNGRFYIIIDVHCHYNQRINSLKSHITLLEKIFYVRLLFLNRFLCHCNERYRYFEKGENCGTNDLLFLLMWDQIKRCFLHCLRVIIGNTNERVVSLFLITFSEQVILKFVFSEHFFVDVSTFISCAIQFLEIHESDCWHFLRRDGDIVVCLLENGSQNEILFNLTNFSCLFFLLVRTLLLPRHDWLWWLNRALKLIFFKLQMGFSSRWRLFFPWLQNVPNCLPSFFREAE